MLLTLLVVYVCECHVRYLIEVKMSTCVRRMVLNRSVFVIVFSIIVVCGTKDYIACT